MGIFGKFFNQPNRGQSEQWNVKACHLADMGNYEEAAFCFDKAIELDPSNVGALFNKANVFHAIGRDEIAISCAQKAVALEPSHAGAWYVKACAEDNLKQFKDAAVSYENFLSKIGRSPYGSHYQSVNNTEFISYAQSRLNKIKIEMLVDEACQLSEINNYEEAIPLFQNAIELGSGDKSDAYLYILKGTCHISLSNIDGANECARLAHEIAPESKDVKQFVNRCRNAACLKDQKEKVVVAHDDEKIADPSGGNNLEISGVLQGHSGVVWSLTMSEDGRNLTSIDRNRTIYTWDIFERRNLKTVDWQGKSMFFDSLSGNMNFDNGMVFSLALSRDIKLLAGGYFDGQIRIWDVDSCRELSVLEGHSDTISSLLISPRNDRLISGSKDGTIRLWDLTNFKEIALRDPQTDVVLSFALTDSGMIATGGYDGTVRLWNLETGALLKLIKVSSNPIWSLALDSEGGILAAGSNDNSITLWNLPAEEKISILKSEVDWVTSLAISPDNALLVSGDNQGGISLWNIESAL